MLKNLESSCYFCIGESRRLRQLIHYLHVCALLASWLNSLPIIYNLMLSVLVAVSWLYHCTASKANSLYLRYTASEGWAVSFGDVYHAVNIKPTTVVGRTLAVLHFTTDSGGRTLVIFNDAMTASDFRRLIVKLKISGYSQGQ